MACRQPDAILTINDLRRFKRACVYAWKRGRQYLYIGETQHFAHRILTHNIIGRADRFRSTDVIEIWFAGSANWKGIGNLEYRLIREFKPKYNTVPDPRTLGIAGEKKEVACIICKRSFMQKRWWQKQCLRPDCKARKGVFAVRTIENAKRKATR